MFGNICPLQCRQEHPLPRSKTAAGDTSCLLMMLNVFKSTMSNFLSLEWTAGVEGKIFSSTVSLFPLCCQREKLLGL